MFLARVADASQTVKHILAAVHAQVEPGALLDRSTRIYPAQTQHFLTSDLLQFLPFLTHGRLCLLEFAQVLGDKALCNIEIIHIDKIEELALALTYMLSKKTESLGIVL